MPSLEPGKRLAERYLLVERLGGGGHAEVWAAEDSSTGSRVALKFAHPQQFSAGEITVALRHEAEMARRLDHPGVLRVEEPKRDGRWVFSPMELASGGDATRLRGASWRLVLPVLMQVARVLEHAHSRGVVHRDIKPGNVLFDAAGRVRVTDFGAASSMGSTRTMSAGSPYFASPQQLRGEPAATSDDVYGLGALAFELLTSYPPGHPDSQSPRPQNEQMPRPVPIHPAPQELLDLVHAMLSRQAEARPNLAQVISGFASLMELANSMPPVPAIPAPQSGRPAPPKQVVRSGLLLVTGATLVFLLGWRGTELWRAHRNADDLVRGVMLENAERWSEASALYHAVLQREVSAQFAVEGLARSSRRAALDVELSGLLRSPQAMIDSKGREAALRALARAEATIPRTDRLAQQIAELRAALKLPAAAR